jgi:hypothetical protein
VLPWARLVVRPLAPTAKAEAFVVLSVVLLWVPSVVLPPRG